MSSNTAQQTLDYLDALIPSLVSDGHVWSACQREYYESIISNLKALAACPNRDTQQLKAEIAALALELDRAKDIHPGYSTVDRVVEKMRQLSAV